MASLTTRKKKMNKMIDPVRMLRGELSRHFGLDPEVLNIGTQKEAEIVVEEIDEDWVEPPVKSEAFFTDFIREPMFPIQQDLCNKILGVDPFTWPVGLEESYALWGKGSGKDRTSAKLVSYVVYKLMCMRRPLKYFGQSAIDIANMSKNGRQAKTVFFKSLKEVVRRVKDPYTKENWFAQRGVDLREKKDIQSSEIRFCHSDNTISHINGDITAHSLDSEVYTGEGYNLFIVVLDELGSFPAENGINLHTALLETITSRYEGFGKLLAISFMYAKDDPMQILMHQASGNPDVHISGPHATWEVNLLRKKQSFAGLYRKNPIRAKRVYECKYDDKRSGFIKMTDVIDKVFENDTGRNPIVGNIECVGYYPEIHHNPKHLSEIRFKEWFKPKDGSLYTIHVDLAKGKQRGDSIGFAMAHPEKMKVEMDASVRKLLIQMGYASNEDGSVSKGVVFDLLLSIRGPDGNMEARFSTIRDFIYKLVFDLHFPIIKATFDGYQSADSVQQMNERGIPTELKSVDRTNDAYENLADLAYQGLAKGYSHIVGHRELKEVDIHEKSGKVDHPQLSMMRQINEGIEKGSKDLTDCMSGTAETCILEIPVEYSAFMG